MLAWRGPWRVVATECQLQQGQKHKGTSDHRLHHPMLGTPSKADERRNDNECTYGIPRLSCGVAALRWALASHGNNAHVLHLADTLAGCSNR